MKKRAGVLIAAALIMLSAFVITAYPSSLYSNSEVVLRFGDPREYILVQQQLWEWIPGPDRREVRITAEEFEKFGDRVWLHTRTADDYFGYEVPKEERYWFSD